MLKKIDVKKGELAIIFKKGEIHTILSAGTHILWDPFFSLSYCNVDLAENRISTSLADKLLNFYPHLVEKYCHFIKVADNEIALRYEDEMLVEIHFPTSNAMFWQGYKTHLVKKINLEQGYRLPDDIALELLQARNTHRIIKGLNELILHHFIDEQIGTLFVDNQFVQIIAPKTVIGLCEFQHKLILGQYKLLNSRIEDLLAATIEQNAPEQLQQFCVQMQVGANQVGLRFEDDLLVEILRPGTKRLYWLNKCKQHMQTIELNEGYELSEQLVQQVLQPKLRKKDVIGDSNVLIAQIPAYHVGVLTVNGRVEKLLDAGITAYWRFNRVITVEIVDTRLQTLEISGQEILTKDKVNLRINLVANWRYSDVLVAFAKTAQPEQLLYRQLQFGLREAIGMRTLDELLENKNLLDEVISAYLHKNMDGFGITPESIGVKDIILPGDMKTILSQVVEAEKAAQANVIRRREETSATRSLLNTARVMENNPVALRLKEMETLERIAERIDKISVVGGLDQVLHGLINIQAKK